MIKAVLFDLGNVLWDDDPGDQLFQDLLLAALARRKITPAEEEVQAALEWGLRSYAPSLYRTLLWRLVKGDRPLYEEVLTETMAQFAKTPWPEYQRLTMPFPGVHELLAELRGRGVKLGLASNNTAWAKQRLAEIGILPYFQSIGISQLVGFYKPDTRLFLQVLKELSVEPSAAVMVGDRLDMDVYPAHLTGMKAIRVRHGRHLTQEPRYPKDLPDEEVDAVREVLAVIVRWQTR